MELDIGIACGQCDTFSTMGTQQCPVCNNGLSIGRAKAHETGPQPAAKQAAAASGVVLSREELMEQARNYVCTQCSTPVPSGHKFCGRCGANVPPEIQQLRTDYFGAMQAPGKARLILIRGDQGVDGLSYLLQGTEHVAGRADAQILFPDDPWLSPRHANFIYRGEKLVVRDEGSLNGVYVRLRQPLPIEPGDYFLCGEQVFRLEGTPKDTSGPDPDMTYFYSSPKRPSPFRIVQILKGGAPGMVYCARENTAQVGREESDLNFPEDVYMSGNHAKIELAPNGKFTLTDSGSKNGTYLRIKGERELAHGDYLFLGKQLLRVEMTT
jgi:pSer/pThr/pTyr-binding forkhead associated (FHA) protein